MDELRLVGQQQEPARVLVESSHAGHDRVAAAPAFREQGVDVRALAFFVRTDQPERLVQQEEQPLGMIGRLAVDPDIGRRGLLGNGGSRFAPHRNAPGVDPVARLAAGAVAEIGEQLIETAHGRSLFECTAATILNF